MEITKNELLFKIGNLEYWWLAEKSESFFPKNRVHICGNFFKKKRDELFKLKVGDLVKASIPLSGERIWFKVISIDWKEQTFVGQCQNEPISTDLTIEQEICIPFELIIHKWGK